MAKINKLDKFISNRIAAGEVVERPASIVKELVENSIDALSNQITLEIKNGGIDSIRVSDNGTGIQSEDVLVAFERHATSKIETVGDLDAIGTLGFRGEALCSIAAVSKVEMYTRTKQAQAGMYVAIFGGETVQNKEIGCPEGTDIIVENVFFNVPARKSFLRKPTIEAAKITDYIMRIILSHPEISFKYINNGKIIFHSSGKNDLLSTLCCVYGGEIVSQVRAVCWNENNIEITGYVSDAGHAKQNRIYQSFFINGRYIVSKLLSQTIQRAFGNRLMIGKFPLCAINIKIDFGDVDINIHPNKLEAKFKDEQLVSQCFFHAISSAIGERIVVSKVETTKQKQNVFENSTLTVFKNQGEEEGFFKSSFEKLVKNNNNALLFEKLGKIPEKQSDEKYKQYIQNKTGNLKTSEEAKEQKISNIDDSHLRTQKFETNFEQNSTAQSFSLRETAQPYSLPEKNIVKSQEKAVYQNATKNQEKQDSFALTSGLFQTIGTAFSTYIIIEQENSLYFIDQHAAHERLIYDVLINEAVAVASQPLLHEQKLSLSPIEFEIIAQNIEIIKQIGFDIKLESFQNTYLKAVPVIFGQAQSQKYLHSVVESLEQFDNAQEPQIKKQAVALMSCKAAVKGNKTLSKSEVGALIKAFNNLGELNCPHGRPVIVAVSRAQVEKMFGRKK